MDVVNASFMVSPSLKPGFFSSSVSGPRRTRFARSSDLAGRHYTAISKLGSQSLYKSGALHGRMHLVAMHHRIEMVRFKPFEGMREHFHDFGKIAFCDGAL